jgi:hypothetical protein
MFDDDLATMKAQLEQMGLPKQIMTKLAPEEYALLLGWLHDKMGGGVMQPGAPAMQPTTGAQPMAGFTEIRITGIPPAVFQAPAARVPTKLERELNTVSKFYEDNREGFERFGTRKEQFLEGYLNLKKMDADAVPADYTGQPDPAA